MYLLNKTTLAAGRKVGEAITRKDANNYALINLPILIVTAWKTVTTI
jgi:hypothetical protein